MNTSTVTGSLQNLEWAFFHIPASQGNSLVWILNQTGSGDCDLYINKNDFPTRSKWIIRDITTNRNSAIAQDNVTAGIYVAGVYGFLSCSYRIQVYIYGKSLID